MAKTDSLLKVVTKISDGIPYSPSCSQPTEPAKDLSKSTKPSVIVKRYHAQEEKVEFDYSLCPYSCQHCRREAIKQILRRDGRRCRGCKIQEKLTIHHIKPREEDGTNDPENLVTLCAPCHDFVECHDSKPRSLGSVLFLSENRIALTEKK